MNKHEMNERDSDVVTEIYVNVILQFFKL